MFDNNVSDVLSCPGVSVGLCSTESICNAYEPITGILYMKFAPDMRSAPVCYQ